MPQWPSAREPTANQQLHEPVETDAPPPTNPQRVQQPPVPARVRQRIVGGEFVDFDNLLHDSLFPARYGASASPSLALPVVRDRSTSGEVLIAQQRSPNRRVVRDLASWLEAWKTYISVLVAHYPARVLELLAYQRIICDASSRFPTGCWLRYDSSFRACAAADQSLRWDSKHHDLWLECFTRHASSPRLAPVHVTAGKPARRPCTYCGDLFHFPHSCPHNPFRVPKHPTPHLGMQLADSAQVVQTMPLALAEQVPASPLSARTSTGQHAHAGSVVSSMHVQGAARPPMGKGTANAPMPLPPIFSQHKLVTPLRPLDLEHELASHPDKGFVSQLLANITSGCNIGYHGPQFPYTARHLPTAYTHTHIITESLTKECTAGRMAGPYSHPPLPNLRYSGLRVVPKKDGGWRVIYHLSAPPGMSINDFIDPACFSLHYCSIDAAIKMVNTLGQNALWERST